MHDLGLRQQSTARDTAVLISHRYKFILLKTEKTASTSLFRMFSAIVSADDKLHHADWDIGRRLAQKHGDLSGLSFRGGGGYLSRRLTAWRGIHQHGRAADIRRFIGADLFDSYTIITSERNPWDRQVSLFTHRRTRNPQHDIRDFRASMHSRLYNVLHYNRLRNWQIYSIDDKPVADIVIRYEHLRSDVERVLDRLGIDAEKWSLPHLRAQKRFDGDDYRSYYDAETRDLIGRWYAKEIAHFGYSFDPE